MAEEAELRALGVDFELAGARHDESRDQTHERRLARAVRSRHDEERAALDVEVEPSKMRFEP